MGSLPGDKQEDTESERRRRRKREKRSDFGEAVGVRAIFYRSETEKETKKSDEERGERCKGESNDGIEVAYDLIRYRI